MITHSSIFAAALQWELKGYKRKPGLVRTSLMDVVKRNPKNLDVSWEEAKELMVHRTDRHQYVAQCIHPAAP